MRESILQPNTDNATDIRSALQNAGLDWKVEKRPIQLDNGYPIPNHFATVRMDGGTGGEQFLGIVGSKYHIIQNESAFGILDDIIAERTAEGKECKYSTVVASDNGRKVAVTVDFGEFEVVPGDTHKSFLTAITSHDGSAATRFMWLDFRFACFNALRRSLAGVRGTDNTTAIRHTASHEGRLDLARQVIRSTGYTQESIAQTLRDLASRQLRASAVKLGIERMFPATKNEDGEIPARVEARRQKVLDLFEYNDNNAVPSIRGSAYNLLNAYTEFVDHYEPVIRTASKRGLGDERIRQERAIFGTGADAKEKALSIITDLALEA